MNDSVDEILLIRENQSQLLPARSMRAGLLGKTLEEALQSILERYPQIFPGTQINPQDPPKFLLLRREMPLSGWSLDHLYVDDKGILTLVETKLFQNPEARREVIGQIIEYGAFAVDRWEISQLRQYASEYWQKKDKELDEVLRETFGKEVEVEEFWQRVAQNLEQGRLRLMIAADELRPEVRRMIEFLNNEMRNVEVLGLECKFYGEEEQGLVVVPRVIGQTQVNIDTKVIGKTDTRTAIWTREKLKEISKEFRDARLKENFEKILNWAVNTGCFIESRNITPSFGIFSRNKSRLFSIYESEKIYFYMKENLFPYGKNERDTLVNELKKFGFLDKNIDPEKVASGRDLSKRLSDMTPEEIDTFLGIIEKYCLSSSKSYR